MALTEQSTWRQRWKRLRENNPLSNSELSPSPPPPHSSLLLSPSLHSPCPVLYTLRVKYDESDHLVVRGSRAVTDRVGEAFGGVMTQSDMAQTLAEIRKMDRNFDKELFIEHCRFEIIPTVLEVSGHYYSSRWCISHDVCCCVRVQGYVRGDLELLKDWCHEAVCVYVCVCVCVL